MKSMLRLTNGNPKQFIDQIIIHERSDPHKRQGYTQEVDVYFKFYQQTRIKNTGKRNPLAYTKNTYLLY